MNGLIINNLTKQLVFRREKMNLFKYYKDNVSKNDFYYTYWKKITENKDIISDYQVYDEIEAIREYKELCMPRANEFYTNLNNQIKFLLLSFFIYESGYEIQEFSTQLSRPNSLEKFAYGVVREYIKKKYRVKKVVTWEKRRNLVNNLHFVKRREKSTLKGKISEDIMMISTRSAKFEEMKIDEKLELLSNLIENILKTENGYEKLNYSKITLNFITDAMITEYRKKLNCFRHASAKSLAERKKLTLNQKKFLIDYGVVIVKNIYGESSNKK